MPFGRIVILAGVLALSPSAWGQPPDAGDYLCRVEQRAGIAKLHLEDSGPPEAFLDDSPRVKFRIRIARGPGYVVTEIPYKGSDADRTAWHTENTVLHSGYLGNGNRFTASEDQGFLNLHRSVDPNAIWFWHSGFEYPGSVDTNLTVRWGTCVADGKPG